MTEEILVRDPLTGLYNREYVLHELERHVELYKRYRHPLSLLLLHFDNLKSLEDTSGDVVRDSVLEYVAELIATNVRAVDISCRYAEDEFVVIMPETGRRSALTVGRRIVELARESRFKVGETCVIVEMSYRSASCPRDGVEAEALLQAARAHRAPWG
jgi:diguanylate cyclase (GGDEF)-like protein